MDCASRRLLPQDSRVRTRYKAWLSATDDITYSLGVYPAASFIHATVPYILPDASGTQVAANWTEFTSDAGHSAPINVLANGSAETASPDGFGFEVWTATSRNGTTASNQNCSGWGGRSTTVLSTVLSGTLPLRISGPMASGWWSAVSGSPSTAFSNRGAASRPSIWLRTEWTQAGGYLSRRYSSEIGQSEPRYESRVFPQLVKPFPKPREKICGVPPTWWSGVQATLLSFELFIASRIFSLVPPARGLGLPKLYQRIAL
jgi:hypothetical protein